LSVTAAVAVERRSVSLLPYLDVILVVLLAAIAVAVGAPALGCTVGAAAWILVRIVSLVVDRKLEDVSDIRRRLGLGVTVGMIRVWVLACAIIALGLTSTRADALACALVIFGAFSAHFAVSAVAHRQRKRMSA